MAKTVYLLTKAGEGQNERTYFNRAGVAFDPNRDGSVNFKLDLFPQVTFQIREKSDADENGSRQQQQGARRDGR